MYQKVQMSSTSITKKRKISLWPVQVNGWGRFFLPGWLEGRGLRQKTDSCSCLLHRKLTHWSGQYDPILYTSHPKQVFIDIVWKIIYVAILIRHCTHPPRQHRRTMFKQSLLVSRGGGDRNVGATTQSNAIQIIRADIHPVSRLCL